MKRPSIESSDLRVRQATRRRSPLLAAAIAVVLRASVPLPGAAQNIDDTDDILSGTTYLVRADDMVLGDPAYTAGSPDMTEVEYFVLNTDSMMITSSESGDPKKLVNLSCTASSASNTPFPMQTQVMRMYDMPDDVIVTFAPTAGVTGSSCENQQSGAMTFYVEEGISGTVHKTVISSDIRTRWLHTAVADFDGDGFDDLFINSDEWTYIATAVDTSSPSSGVQIVAALETGGSKNPLNDPAIGDFNADGNLDVAWAGTGFSSGDTPAVFLLTVCAGPLANTVCENANPFDIKFPTNPIQMIAPSAPTGSLVEVGGHCVNNDNNQVDSELRAPAMAVAAGQYDTSTPGDELVVVVLYEDNHNDCHVAAESYRFTQFDVTFDGEGNVTGVTGMDLTPTQEHVLDNLGPHSHISNPASIYAEAGNLDWSSDREYIAIAISGGTDHNVLVVTIGDDLAMTSTDAPFSTDHDKSFAGMAIGRFSAAPGDGEAKECTQDSDCTDTCKDKVCEQSGMACTANGDCQGSCTSYGLCSYVAPSQYDLQVATFLMAHSSEHDSNVYIYTSEPAGTAPKEIQLFTVDKFVQTATNRGVRAGSLLRRGDLQGRSVRLGNPTVARINGSIQPDIIVSAPPMHVDWLAFAPLQQSQFCPSTQSCSMLDPANLCNCTDNLIPDTSCGSSCTVTDVTCSDGTPIRCLTNISGLTSQYSAQYAFMEGDTSSTSTTENTSWSLGASVMLSEETSTLTPAYVKISQKVSFAANNTYTHSVSTTNSSFEGSTLALDVATHFDDYVWYTTRQYNVYYYPVIGQEICVDSCTSSNVCSISGVSCTDNDDCPNDQTSCDAADMQQLYVQYSGDVSVQTTSSSTSGLEWYQPVHEPGQVLSYPSSCDELEARYGVDLCDGNGLPDDSSASLLATSPSFKTDDSSGTFSLEWTVGKGSSKTTSKGGQFSQSLSETVTASTPSYESVVAGFRVKETVSINSAESISTARTNSTNLDSSTGIDVGQPGTFLTPTTFEYGLQGLIFGDLPTKGTLQAPPDTNAASQVDGVMRSAFFVDVTSSDNFWSSGAYSSAVDLAFNRPAHVSVPPGKGSSSPATTQCLPVSQENDVTADCAQYDEPDPSPANLWSSTFYHLRGFFVTPADTPDQGPSLTMATENDVLALQVRVYNYSLRNMDSIVGSQIKVDFYAQEWDTECHAPVGYYTHTGTCTQAGTGAEVSCDGSCDPCCIVDQPVDSIYLGQDQLPPLPGFQQDEDTPNWAVAGVTFDTGNPSMCPSGGCADKNFLFWVVTWLEGQNSGGDPVLAGELLDHGLQGALSALTTLKSIADICPRASCDSSCGVCLQEFTNNVGFYHVPFLVAPETTGLAAAARAPRRAGAGAGILRSDLAVERVSVKPAVAQPGEKVVVRAGLRALGLDLDGQIVRFYAIPPEGGSLTLQEAIERYGSFDEEILPRIRADRVHEAQVPFLPTDVGRYQLLVSALVGGKEELIGEVDLEVGIAPPATPTSTAVPPPTATTGPSGVRDDGCAISPPARRASTGGLMLLLAALLIGVRRAVVTPRST